MAVVVLAVITLAVLASLLWSNVSPSHTDRINENTEVDPHMQNIKKHTPTETAPKDPTNPTQTTTGLLGADVYVEVPPLTQTPPEEKLLGISETQAMIPKQTLTSPDDSLNTRGATHQACEIQQTKRGIACEKLEDRRWKSETDENQSVPCWSENFVCESCCNGERKGIGSSAHQSCWVGTDQRNGYQYDWNNPDAYKHCCGIQHG